MIVATPTETPVTTPELEPIVAIDGALLVHVPPPEFVSVVVLPTHTRSVPPMADGADITVIVRVAAQPVGSVYVISAVPVATAVTRPVVDPIVATAVLLLVHVPPGIELVSVVVLPAHNELSPDIGASALTVTTCVVKHPPGSV